MGWYDRKVRRVRDLSCGDTRIFLELEVRRLDCRNCGKVTEFSDLEIDTHIQEQANIHGFALQGHSLELYGHCADCREA